MFWKMTYLKHTRVTYNTPWKYLRQTKNILKILYGQTHTVTYRSYTLLTCEYIGATYNGRRVIKINVPIFFLHFIVAGVRVMSRTHIWAHKCISATCACVLHTWACATYIYTSYAHHTHTQSNASADMIWCGVAHSKNADFDHCAHDLAHTNVSYNYFPWINSVVKALVSVYGVLLRDVVGVVSHKI